MSFLEPAQKVVVVTALEKFVKDGAREFTARDFVERAQDDDYEEFGIEESDRRDVASYMRELFNAGNPLFKGFGSMKVNGNTGPLLFFKVWPSSRAGRKAKSIVKELEDNSN